MRKHLNTLVLSLMLFTNLQSLLAEDATATFAHIKIDSLPEWTVKYAEDRRPSFDIDKLMQVTGLSRLQAVEVQSQFYESLAKESETSNSNFSSLFSEALKSVKSGHNRSGIDEERLKRAKFIAVFDLDETLYDQFVAKDNSCALPVLTTQSGRKIVQNPGWQKAFEWVRMAGGEIVIFSAFPDNKVIENLSKWQWGGEPLVSVSANGEMSMHPKIAGVLGNSFLVRSPAVESNGRKSTPTIKRVKDLRLFNEDLTKVVILDDNPQRVMFDQMHLVLTLQKFDGDIYCDSRKSASNARVVNLYRKGLSNLALKLMEAQNYANITKSPLSATVLPYSFMGDIAVRSLILSSPITYREAVKIVRKNPGLIAKRF